MLLNESDVMGANSDLGFDQELGRLPNQSLGLYPGQRLGDKGVSYDPSPDDGNEND
jgi:hypothetical protein